jgi:hypothetical protein
VITGWGVGQYPWMLVDKVTIADAARADAARADAARAGAALAGLLVVVGLAGRHRAARARISAVAHPHQGMDTRLNRFKDGASDALVAAGLTTCSRASASSRLTTPGIKSSGLVPGSRSGADRVAPLLTPGLADTWPDHLMIDFDEDQQ